MNALIGDPPPAERERVRQVLAKRLRPESAEELTDQLLKGAESGKELEAGFDEWLNRRFIYQLVWLGREDYTRALTRALRLALRFAGTDFGSSRQRDFGQVWTDTTRGFLGEIALERFTRERFGIGLGFDTRIGKVEEFLPSDIAWVEKPGEERRAPRRPVSVKATKFNGRWLDIPGAQYQHSEVFILIKIGVTRTHLLTFMKAISFLRDKLFTEAKALGELTEKDAQRLWDHIPDFEEIPAYIAGFVDRLELNMPIHALDVKVRGTKRRCLVVQSGVGLLTEANLRSHRSIQALDPGGLLPIKIDPIIDRLGSAQHFFANSGALTWGENDWQTLMRGL
jgi:hypothetical protein